jgi:hypothetical protein
MELCRLAVIILLFGEKFPLVVVLIQRRVAPLEKSQQFIKS